MNSSELRVASALLNTPTGGTIELTRDWKSAGLPDLRMAERPYGFSRLAKCPALDFGLEAGFFVDETGEVVFCFDPRRAGEVDLARTQVYVAGSFNGWQAAIGDETWCLKPEETSAGALALLLRRPVDGLLSDPWQQFKFVTSGHHWFPVSPEAPNVVVDSGSNRNHALNPERTGQHRIAFELAEALDLSLAHAVILRAEGAEDAAELQPSRFFFQLESRLPLGAIVEGGSTTFRLFAPRASWVKVACFESLAESESPEWLDLHRLDDGAWEVSLPGERHGWFYWYRVDGPKGRFSAFDPEFNILDPYALAAVGRVGPGIVIDLPRLAIAPSYFKTPPWHDLVVMEAHLRDLQANSAIVTDPKERLTFGGLAKWIDQPDCYLKKLGVNAIELQPVQEFDSSEVEEYHWGYMPVNYFSPESSYGKSPIEAAQVVEFQELVEAFHRNGLTVILDVVYNHVGEPNHLLRIDKLYYFEQSADGSLTNWSGCGNDLRARAAMVRRLIIDSLTHLIRFYGVDGFRFDLAELLGVEVLQDIENAIKQVKPAAVLIAEPWSFRGHIAAQLRDTGFASWNDGYRSFLRDYLLGRASHEAAAYYLRGAPWHFARWPAQTVNYVESHDDRAWIDVITENPENNGYLPTLHDVRRTHLMVAFLMTSIGIPMLHAGQDFLRSKHGVHNTYQRGDLNALDYHRLLQYPGTHAYFAGWIRFRMGRWGRLLRHFARPIEGFLEVFHAPDGNAIAAVFNANGSLGTMRLLFAINPHLHDVSVTIEEFASFAWRQVADHDHFFGVGEADHGLVGDRRVYVPALGCGLWVVGG